MPAAITLGDFEITHVQDGVYWWDGGALFGVVPKTLWTRKLPCDESNRIPLGFNCYILRNGEHTILIETGGGDKMDERARERMRVAAVTAPLADTIQRSGIDPESIDIVINSHLHWDHASGNTLGGKPAFPRAQYYASRGEWEHAHERLIRDSVSYIDANYDPLVDSGQMTLIAPGYEVVPGVRMELAAGHTRDMMVVTVASGGGTFCFLSDLCPHTAHLTPTWLPAFDLYPLTTIESKQRVFARAADEGWICGFGHDVDQPFARIRRDPKTHFRAESH